jgi:glycosyltransferase involved in cell wall biosynthesis
MKILLLGEFSALHKNLKEGLIELGHDAVVAASGDGFKKIPVDISFDSRFKGNLGKVLHRLNVFLKLPDLKNFDVVQIINPYIFGTSDFPRKYFINQIIKNNRKFFLLGAGSDSYYWRYGRELLEYGPFDDNLKYDLKLPSSPLETDKAFYFNEWLLEQSNGVIPIMYDYEIGYNSVKNRLNTIPIPINTNKIKYEENIVKGKVIVFHGLSRYGFKGTRHVEKAFNYLRKKYPNDLELIIDGNLPLNEYLELMSRTNVVIDQTNSYSLGVNGVYALAMGKVVMGGAEPESLKSHRVVKSPVINLKPDHNSIIQAIEKLLENKKNIQTLGYESRKYVEEVHDHIKVAQQYIDTWNSN